MKPWAAFWIDAENQPHVEEYSTKREWLDGIPRRSREKCRAIAIRWDGNPWEDNFTHGPVLSPHIRLVLVAAGVTEGLPE